MSPARGAAILMASGLALGEFGATRVDTRAWEFGWLGQPAAQGDGLRLTTFQSDCYEVATNLERREAVRIAHHMDQVFREYERRLSSFGTRNAKRIRLYLLASQQDYQEHLSEQGIDGTNSGGMFYVIGGEAGLATFEEGQSRRRMLGEAQ